MHYLANLWRREESAVIHLISKINSYSLENILEERRDSTIFRISSIWELGSYFDDTVPRVATFWKTGQSGNIKDFHFYKLCLKRVCLLLRLILKTSVFGKYGFWTDFDMDMVFV